MKPKIPLFADLEGRRTYQNSVRLLWTILLLAVALGLGAGMLIAYWWIQAQPAAIEEVMIKCLRI